jgi:hypothetical protein
MFSVSCIFIWYLRYKRKNRGSYSLRGCKMHDLPLFSYKHLKFFDSKVATVSDRMHTDSPPETMAGYWNRTSLKNSVWLILDHVHFQHKRVIYFVQTFGNIYTIVLFVNTRCVYSTQLRGSFCSRTLRKISHLFSRLRNADIRNGSQENDNRRLDHG